MNVEIFVVEFKLCLYIWVKNAKTAVLNSSDLYQMDAAWSSYARNLISLTARIFSIYCGF